MKKAKVKKFNWSPFEKLLGETGSRTGQILGMGHRAFFIEIITPGSGSFYLRIPSDYALMSPKQTKEIYKVGDAFSSYYLDLQNQLKESSIPIASIDGEFLVSANEVFTFNKNITPDKTKTIVQTLEDMKISSGIDISDDEEDDEESSSSSTSSTEVEEVDLAPTPQGEPVETVIEFDSEDEMQDFFDKKEEKKKKSPEVPEKPKKKKHANTVSEILQIGVIYPLLTLGEFFKKTRAKNLEKWVVSAKAEIHSFESGIVKNMISQIDSKVDQLRDRMAKKISESTQKEKRLQSEIRNNQKSLREAQQILDKNMALDVKKFQAIVLEAKNNLRHLHLELAQEKEDIKFSLTYFLSALDEIE